jgi:hypothetical protein
VYGSCECLSNVRYEIKEYGNAHTAGEDTIVLLDPLQVVRCTRSTLTNTRPKVGMGSIGKSRAVWKMTASLLDCNNPVRNLVAALKVALGVRIMLSHEKDVRGREFDFLVDASRSHDERLMLGAQREI